MCSNHSAVLTGHVSATAATPSQFFSGGVRGGTPLCNSSFRRGSGGGTSPGEIRRYFYSASFYYSRTFYVMEIPHSLAAKSSQASLDSLVNQRRVSQESSTLRWDSSKRLRRDEQTQEGCR